MVLFAAIIHAALAIGALSTPPHGCLDTPLPPACQPVLDAVNAAVVSEQSRRVSNVTTDPFFQTPPNFASLKPGDLIELNAPSGDTLSKYSAQLPPALTFYRLSYVSADLDNKPVPASAFILLPYSRPRKSANKPLETIAWGHGSAGISRICNPSGREELYYSYEAPFNMALQGFAVIAPDYAGQGTDTPFHFLAGPSHSADMVNAVSAAHKALPKVLSKEWAVVGHSEGGLTAWALNEREAHTPTEGFLGAVSIAPSLANLRIVRANVARTNGNLGNASLYPSYTLESIARLNKTVDVSKYYSKVGAERAKLSARGCQEVAIAAFSNLTFSDVFKDASWLNSSFAEEWESRNGVHGEKELAKPMLIIEGVEDEAVPRSVIERTFNTQCQAHPNAKVHLSRYPNANHDTVAFVSQLEYFDWVRDLFNGKGPTGCDNSTIELVMP